MEDSNRGQGLPGFTQTHGFENEGQEERDRELCLCLSPIGGGVDDLEFHSLEQRMPGNR